MNVLINVSFGQKYRVFQGLDCLYEAVFVKERKKQEITDEQILRKLQNYRGRKVAISHNFGVFAKRLEEMPLSRLWVMKQIRLGSIDIDAKKYLLKF